MRAIDDQLIVPRQRRKRRSLPTSAHPIRLNRLHTFILGTLAGASIMLLRPTADPAPAPAITPTPGPAEQEEIVEYGPPPLLPSEAHPRPIEGELRPNEFISDVLISAGATAAEADRAVTALGGLFDFRTARPGQRYTIEVDEAGNILFFEYRAGPAEVFQVARRQDELVGTRKEIDQRKEVVEVRGTIEHSLYDAFLTAGESENLAMSFADAFRFDVDFFHDTQKGDSFRLYVEKITNPEGELLAYGRVLAAEYSGAIGTKRLYHFEDGFYDEKGTAAQRAFLKSPLSFTRISSGFGYRHHPVHGRRHFHGGVDYAAPVGTPVHAIGEGTVTFAAYKGANGNMVTIRHSGGYESYYLHLSRLNVHRGQRVSQSTVIGKVGSTGRSTGPHLDFRIKKNGKYLDPSKQVAPRMKVIDASDRARFARSIEPWRQRFEALAQNVMH